MTGSVTCGVYRSLYDLERVKEESLPYPSLCLKKWEGRWKKETMKEVEEIVRIELAKESLSGNA
jgi:pyruvate-formate lyase-activating enzyme